MFCLVILDGSDSSCYMLDRTRVATHWIPLKVLDLLFLWITDPVVCQKSWRIRKLRAPATVGASSTLAVVVRKTEAVSLEVQTDKQWDAKMGGVL